MRRTSISMGHLARPILLLAFAVAVTSATVVAQVVIATIPVGTYPYYLVVNPATNKIYVANDDDVTVIDGTTLATSTVPVGNGPAFIAVNPVTNKIFVSNNENVTVIDGTTLATSTVSVGTQPYGIAVNPVTNKIFVGNYDSNNVTVIDGTTLATSTVSVGTHPYGLAVNPVTNKIYVSNYNSNNVTVIDGTTLATTTVSAGSFPNFLALNSVTNKIYVANQCGNDPTCHSPGTVTVIDGTTLATTTVSVGDGSPVDVAVNPVTNNIYIANWDSNTVTVIDGSTLATKTVSVGGSPQFVAVNEVTNKIYVPISPDKVTVIDGTTLHTSTVSVGRLPEHLAVNPVTNKIYVPNYGDNTVSVIAGAPANKLRFVAVTPCRLVDTRNANGEFGGPPLQGQTSRSFPLPQASCNIPATAAAYSLNVTVVPHGPLGYLTVWPTGEDQPYVSTLNSYDGRVKANAAIVPAGYQGAVSVYVSDPTNVVLDIDGYFAPVSGATLTFYSLPPCRVADTRNPVGDLGGPYLTGGVPRDFPILEATSCNIPDTAQAYSLNFTVVPHGPLNYLTVWPTGQAQPYVSTLNAPTGAVTANAAIVPAGNGGEVSTFAYNDTDLIIDIDGYFAPPGEAGGLSLYPAAPCRVLDTRNGHGAFSGTLSPPVDVLGSVCAPPNQSQAYVFNATVVPSGSLGYLTLWPDGQNQPYVSTLNAYDGAVTSNMAIVPAGTGGKIDAYAYGLTQLILDISSYFAP
jgi:YVTN family beta-propeller protein